MKNLRFALFLVLAGCASVSYLDQAYGDIKEDHVAYAGDTWAIRNDRANEKMIVTTSLGRAAADGFSWGLTTAPGAVHMNVAQEYLRVHGMDCRAVGATLVLSQTYEVSYIC